jgi:Restriction endonuclease
MNDRMPLEQEFEDLVRQIYETLGYNPIAQRDAPDKGYDFTFTTPDGKSGIIEVKLYRTRVISRQLVVRAAELVEAIRILAKKDQAVLVLGSRLNIPIVNVGNTIVVDMTKLMEMVAKYPTLATHLDSIARQISPMPVNNDADILAARIFGDAYNALPEPESPEPPKGKALADALRAVKVGKPGARQFELKASDALKYLFADDFLNWQLQPTSASGIHRNDLVARIASEHDFWASIVRYFKTWYVIFEFKNHTRFITQGEIYSTEKYLFVPAMRSVAFIISCKGADKNAKAVMRGALRETGKLILSLSLDDVCAMLEMKDAGNDPNTLLFERLDEMLMKLER